MNRLDNRSYFFDVGIRFACRSCGACCTGDPGVVRVSERELAEIAAFLVKPVSCLAEDYLDRWQDGFRIKEDDAGRCLFFDNGCRIYPARPNQCRTFPFWVANLRSEARWHHIRSQCPGIGSGRLYTKNQILDMVSRSSDTPP